MSYNQNGGNESLDLLKEVSEVSIQLKNTVGISVEASVRLKSEFSVFTFH